MQQKIKSHENKSRLSNNEVFVFFSMVLKKTCPPYEQRRGSKYVCIEQYLEDKT